MHNLFPISPNHHISLNYFQEQKQLANNEIIILPSFGLYLLPLMHSELQDCYVLTFNVNPGLGLIKESKFNYEGQYKFENLNFAFTVNNDYQNKGCRAILPDIGTLTLDIFDQKRGVKASSFKNKKPRKIMIPTKCFNENKINKINYSFYQGNSNAKQRLKINNERSQGVINFIRQINLKYQVNVFEKDKVAIINPVAYRIFDYNWAPKIESLISEKITIFDHIRTMYRNRKPLTTLFEYLYELENFRFPWNAFNKDDAAVIEKINLYYNRPLLATNAKTLINFNYLSNSKNYEINSVFNQSPDGYLASVYYWQTFLQHLNLSTIDIKIKNGQNAIYFPINNNGRAKLVTTIKIPTNVTQILLEIQQEINPLQDNKKLPQKNLKLVFENEIDVNNSFFAVSYIIDEEQVKSWYIAYKIKEKDYEKFISEYYEVAD